jgi:hypothetical protein
MAISNEPQEELKIRNELDNHYGDVVDVIDADYALYNLNEFKIPTDEGKWDNVTSNRARIEADRAINYLAYAKRRLYVADDGSDRHGRGRLAKTEECVNGFLYAAERLYDSMPESPTLHYLKSFYAIVRGGTSERIYLHEDEDGQVICDYAIWDRRNVRYTYNRNGLLKVYYTSWVNVDTAKGDWDGFNGSGDSNNLVEMVNVFDCSDSGKEAQEAVILDGEYVQEPEDIGLKYIPVRIGGNVRPYIVTAGDINASHAMASWFVANRALYEHESRLLTYNMTAAGIQAKGILKLFWDSSKGASNPPELESGSSAKGKVWMLDKGQGQDADVLNPNARGTEINNMLMQMQGKLNDGGVTSMANPPYPDTAQGTEIIAHETLSKLHPFQLAIQHDYVWAAGQIAQQYKNGQFTSQEVRGFNQMQKRFKVKIKPDEIVDDCEFECQLVPDILRDREHQIGIFAAGVSSGAWSRQTGREICQLVEDPDREEDLIAMETVSTASAPMIGAMKMLVDSYNDKSETGKMRAAQARYTINMLAKQQQIQQGQMEQQSGMGGGMQGTQGGGGQPQEGIPRPMPPQAGVGQASSTATVIPADIRNAVKARQRQ